jgi:hypothetical protein
MGILLAALLHGVMGAASTLLAIQIYKRLGWSLFGSLIVLSFGLQFAVVPLTSRIRRHFSGQIENSQPGKP